MAKKLIMERAPPPRPPTSVAPRPPPAVARQRAWDVGADGAGAAAAAAIFQGSAAGAHGASQAGVSSN